MLHHLGFLCWFAWLDLFQHRRARRVTVTLAATIAGLVALTLLTYGLVLGYQARRLEHLRRDPLALALWISESIPAGAITAADLERLHQVARQRLGPEAVRGCHGFHLLTLDWFDRREPQLSRSIRGRTLAPGDPLLQSCTLAHGRPFEKADEEGVIVSAALLRMLHAEGPSTERLQLRFRAANRTLPVVGVLAQPLPGELHFLLTEAGEVRLRQTHPDPPVREILSGPLPESWRQLRELPPVVRTWLQKCEVRWVGPEPQGNDQVWRLAAESTPPLRLSQWRSCLEGVQAHMKSLGYPGHDRFVLPQTTGAIPEQPEPRKGYSQAVLYLRQPEALVSAAHLIRELGYHVDLDVVEQLERLARFTGRTLAALTAIVAVLGLLALGNLYVIQDLRAQQKVMEVGMLKALGLDRATLRAVVLLEATLIWLAGLLPGLLAGWGSGLVVSGLWLDPATNEPLTELHVPWWLLLAIVVGTGLACLGSSWWASRSARRAAPIRSLSSG